MKTSVMSCSYGASIRSGEMTTADFVNAAKELGFDGVELMETLMEEPEREGAEAKELLEKYGMVVASYDIGVDIAHPDDERRKENLEKLKEGLKRAANLKPVVVLTHGSAGHTDPDAKQRYIDSLKEAAEFAGELGIVLTIENQGRLTATSAQVKEIVQGVNLPNMKVTIDLGNFTLAGEDNVSAVKNLVPFVAHTHAKDWRRIEPVPGASGARGIGFAGTVLGEGVVDLEGCVAVLKEANYDGFVSLEYEGREKERESVKRGMEYLKRLIAQ